MTLPPKVLTNFDLIPAEARKVQATIPPLVVREDDFEKIRTVAGADIALDHKRGFAAVIIYSFPELREIERSSSVGLLNFPYVPGLLAFRELPLLLEVFAKLRRMPDLILADAHGWAHPRRAGMACHLGIVLDTPTIGCAKSLLVGEYAEPGKARGSTSPLTSPLEVGPLRDGLRDGREQIGTVLRTRNNVRPVFVSCGHRISLATAVPMVMQCCDGYRIPKPQREADRWVKQLKEKSDVTVAVTMKDQRAKRA